jgi:hypothetical protein
MEQLQYAECCCQERMEQLQYAMMLAQHQSLDFLGLYKNMSSIYKDAK